MFVGSTKGRTAGLILMMGILFFSACANFPYTPAHVKGPLIGDRLKDGMTVAEVEYGVFTPDGWQPGPEGSLTYTLPGMTQGVISFDLLGIDRSNFPATTILTLYEDGTLDYVDPYVINNPYLVKVGFNEFGDAPQSPFNFLWTAKIFPSSALEEDRYIPGLPLGFEEASYMQVKQSKYMPLYPDETYRVTIEWFNGTAKLIVNGNVLAEHVYRPIIFNPRSLKLVLGKAPDEEFFGMPHLIFSNVNISFPKY